MTVRWEVGAQPVKKFKGHSSRRASNLSTRMAAAPAYVFGSAHRSGANSVKTGKPASRAGSRKT